MPIFFSEGDGKRIANVVKRVEGTPTGRAPSTPQYSGTSDEVWIKITDADYSTGKYAWTLQVRKDDGTWEDDADEIEGTLEENYAKETNGFKYVPDGAIVLAYHLHDHMVFLYDNYVVSGTASGTIGAGGSGTVSITFPSGAGTLSAANPGAAIADGKAVHVQWFLDDDWEIVPQQAAETSEVQLFVRFQLTGELDRTAASISATRIGYWGGSDPGGTVTVYNPALASGFKSYRGFNGDTGIAVWDTDEEKFWIVSGLRPATPREFIATKSTPSSDNATWDILDAYALDGGPLPAGGISLAANPFNLRMHIGEQALLAEDFYAESIYVKQVYHTTSKVVKEVVYDTGNLEQEIYEEVALQVDDIASTETVVEPEEVDVIVEVDFDSPNLTKQTRKLWVWDANTAASPTNILTASSHEVVTDTAWSSPNFTETKKSLLVLSPSEVSGSTTNVFTATTEEVVDDITWTGTYMEESKVNLVVLGATPSGSTTIFTGATDDYVTEVYVEGDELKYKYRPTIVIAYSGETAVKIDDIEECEEEA